MWFLSPEAEVNAAYLFKEADEAEGNETYIFWCKLAEGRIETFHIVRLQVTNRYVF